MFFLNQSIFFLAVGRNNFDNNIKTLFLNEKTKRVYCKKTKVETELKYDFKLALTPLCVCVECL